MKSMKGFTLIELMIVVAIIGILASVALPAYNQYTQKSKFTEVVSATQSVKTAVDVCFQVEGSLAACDSANSDSVNDAVTGGSNGDKVDSVTAVIDGNGVMVITATAAAAVDGFDGTENFVLTSNDGTGGSLTWTSSCTPAGYC